MTTNKDIKKNLENQDELIAKFDKENRTRKFINPIFEKLFKYSALIIVFYHLIFASGYFKPEVLRHRSIHVGMMLFMTFLNLSCNKKIWPQKNCLVWLYFNGFVSIYSNI